MGSAVATKGSAAVNNGATSLIERPRLSELASGYESPSTQVEGFGLRLKPLIVDLTVNHLGA